MTEAHISVAETLDKAAQVSLATIDDAADIAQFQALGMHESHYLLYEEEI